MKDRELFEAGLESLTLVNPSDEISLPYMVTYEEKILSCEL